MQQTLLQAWRNKSLWLWLLLPVSWLYGLVFWLNKTMYRLGLKPVYYPNVPVIVVGNITVGGSGKTPLIIAVVTYLQQKGLTVGVISRGYGGQPKLMPCIVTANSKPSEVGDEPCLIVQRTGVPMAVCPNRGQAIELLLEQYPSIQLILRMMDCSILPWIGMKTGLSSMPIAALVTASYCPQAFCANRLNACINPIPPSYFTKVIGRILRL